MACIIAWHIAIQALTMQLCVWIWSLGPTSCLSAFAEQKCLEAAALHGDDTGLGETARFSSFQGCKRMKGARVANKQQHNQTLLIQHEPKSPVSRAWNTQQYRSTATIDGLESKNEDSRRPPSRLIVAKAGGRGVMND